MTAIFRETENLPSERRPSRLSRLSASVRGPEITFAIGTVLAVAGIALVAVPLALFAAGVALMLVAWRAA